ncbi:hypothetical protein KA005_73830 [bacterium]|nr:hypothetical protein [bacterium]
MDQKSYDLIAKLQEQILNKLDIISKLLAKTSVEGLGDKEQISFLSDLGFQPKDIAEILGKSPASISMAKLRMKKK